MRESERYVTINVVGIHGFNGQNLYHRLQLDSPLPATAADGHDSGVGTRELTGSNRRSRCGSKCRDLDGIHEREQLTGSGVAQDDDALDGWQSVRLWIAGKIRVCLGDEILPAILP